MLIYGVNILISCFSQVFSAKDIGYVLCAAACIYSQALKSLNNQRGTDTNFILPRSSFFSITRCVLADEPSLRGSIALVNAPFT